MKWGKLLLGVGWACVLYACSDDDGKDDTIMNMSELTGKYWYYNAWLGDKYGMGQSDLLEVIRFEKGRCFKDDGIRRTEGTCYRYLDRWG